MRQAAKRDANEPKIIKYLRRCGASVEQLNGSGVPDLLIGWQGKNFLAEVKGKTGKLTAPQISFHSAWKGQCAVIHNIKEAKQLLKGEFLMVDIFKLERKLALLIKQINDRSGKITQLEQQQIKRLDRGGTENGPVETELKEAARKQVEQVTEAKQILWDIFSEKLERGISITVYFRDYGVVRDSCEVRNLLELFKLLLDYPYTLNIDITSGSLYLDRGS